MKTVLPAVPFSCASLRRIFDGSGVLASALYSLETSVHVGGRRVTSNGLKVPSARISCDRITARSFTGQSRLSLAAEHRHRLDDSNNFDHRDEHAAFPASWFLTADP